MRGMEEKQIENTGAGGGQFVYETYKKGICIRKYRGVGENAVIPPVIDEKPVIAIERKAFLSCKTIREITLPDTVVEIGDWAFAHAEGLRFITIPHHALVADFATQWQFDKCMDQMEEMILSII